MSGFPTIQDLLDPRGRASRTGLLKVAALLMAADIALVIVLAGTGTGFTGSGAIMFKLASVWLATVAAVKRLHDLDLSGWLIAKGLAAVIGWSIVVSSALLTTYDAADALNPAHLAFWLNLGFTSAPVLAALVWLHVAPGTPGFNSHGSEPAARGFSDMAARPVSAGMAAR